MFSAPASAADYYQSTTLKTEIAAKYLLYAYACMHVCVHACVCIYMCLSLCIWVRAHINKHLHTRPHVFSLINEIGFQVLFIQYVLIMFLLSQPLPDAPISQPTQLYVFFSLSKQKTN